MGLTREGRGTRAGTDECAPAAIVICRGEDDRCKVVMFADADAARRFARDVNGFFWGPIAWWEYVP